MSVITIEEALLHLRVDDDAAIDDVQSKLDSAEDYAMRFLNRNFYKSDTDLDVAKALAETQIVPIGAAYSAAMSQASLLDDQFGRKLLEENASRVQAEQMVMVHRTFAGIVINPSIRAAVLLMLGHLYANREDIAELPQSSQALLWPYRVGLGV